MDNYTAIPLSDLLPHKAPMILIDRVVAFKDDFVHASLTIRKDALFFEKGAVPAYVSVEYMAQTVAAWNGLTLRSLNQLPRLGFLIGTRKLKLGVTSFKEGSVLDVFGQSIYCADDMASFECWVEIAGTRVASATLNVFQPNNEEI